MFRIRLGQACCLVGFLPFTAVASNGLNLIGYGAESVAMGGADVAVAADTLALNTNPAGIARLGGHASTPGRLARPPCLAAPAPLVGATAHFGICRR